MSHPAIEHRWEIVPFTRGNGVEVSDAPAGLYPHFRHASGGDWDKHQPKSLDFVFIVGLIGGTNEDCWETCIKDGGYLVVCNGDSLQITQLGTGAVDERALFTVDTTFPGKSACVVRYGGFGDSIQAANILPELKRQGFNVTFMCTPGAKAIVEHDPHIDGWLVQDNDQVLNEELPEYWAHWAKKFDRFVQLSESVEGTLLAYPGRSNHAWPDAVRRKYLGRNYLEWTSELAELEYRSEARFYETDDEKRTASELIVGLRKRAAGISEDAPAVVQLPPAFIVMLALSGSAAHKFYPHQDDVIANALAAWPEAHFILTGDDACRVLEAGWERHPRVLCASGELSIRMTLALAKQCHVVMGPETGVLNAVAFEPLGKVIMLSHSSIENLTKHWVNTVTLTAANTPCYPCHRMHYGREFCPEHELSGAAMCQWDIPGESAFRALAMHHHDWQQQRSVFTIRQEQPA